MNKIHKTVWNASSGSWVAASELTKTQGKSSQLNSLAKAALGLMLFSGFGATAYAAECTMNDQGHWHISNSQCDIQGQVNNTQLGKETGLSLDNSIVNIGGDGNLTINGTSQNSDQNNYHSAGIELNNTSHLSLNDLNVNIKPGEQQKTNTVTGISMGGGSHLTAKNVNVNVVYAGENPNVNRGNALSYGMYISGNDAAKKQTLVNIENANIEITNTVDSDAGKFGLMPYALSGMRVISENRPGNAAQVKVSGKLTINAYDSSKNNSADYITGIYVSGRQSKVYLYDSDITIGKSGQHSSALKIGKNRNNDNGGGEIHSIGHMNLDTTAAEDAPTVRLVASGTKLIANYASSSSTIKSANTAILFGSWDYLDRNTSTGQEVALNNAKITTTSKDKSLILVNAGVNKAKMTLQGAASEATAADNGWLVEVEDPSKYMNNETGLTLTLADHAVAKGLMNVSGEGKLDVNVQDGATWQLQAKNDLDEQRTSVSSLNLINGGVLDASKPKAGQTGSDYIVHVPLLNNDGGVINLAGGSYQNKLTVEGDYQGGNGAVVKVNTLWNTPGSIDGADSKSDVLHITGTASGTTTVQAIGADGNANIIDGSIQQAKTQLNTVPVVQVDKGGQAGAFVGEAKTNSAGMAQLTSSVTANGGRDYFWSLTAKDEHTGQVSDIYASTVAGYVAMPRVNMEQNYSMIGTQAERQNRDLTQSQQGTVWSRAFGQHVRQSGKERLDLDTDIYGFQIGRTFLDRSVGTDGRQLVNGYVGYSHADTDFGDQYRAVNGVVVGDKYTGKAKTDMASLGVNTTYYTAKGSYVDMLGQVSYLHNKYDARNDVRHNQNGWGAAVSAEVGHQFTLSEKAGWSLVPQAQLVYQYVDLSNFNDGIREVDQNDQHSVRGRIGGKVAYKTEQQQADTFYAVANVWHDFVKMRSVEIGADAIRENYANSWGEIGLGVQLPVYKNSLIYGDTRYQHDFGSHKRAGWHGSIGFKYNWK